MCLFIFYYDIEKRESYHNGIVKDTGENVETQQQNKKHEKKKQKFIEAQSKNIIARENE